MRGSYWRKPVESADEAPWFHRLKGQKGTDMPLTPEEESELDGMLQALESQAVARRRFSGSELSGVSFSWAWASTYSC